MILITAKSKTHGNDIRTEAVFETNEIDKAWEFDNDLSDNDWITTWFYVPEIDAKSFHLRKIEQLVKDFGGNNNE